MGTKRNKYLIERVVTVVEQIEIEIEETGDEKLNEDMALADAKEAEGGDWFIVSEDVGYSYVADLDFEY